MSPSAIPVSDQGGSLNGNFYKKFGITRNGFLPSEEPLRHLPNAYYGPWEVLIEDLPQLLRDGCFRAEIEKMPLLSTEHLETEEEYRRAYVILTFFAHGHIWGGDIASERLPPVIAVPLLRVSSHLELAPVATYATLALWNFTSTSSWFGDLDSLQMVHTFSGTESESWFFMLSVAMERQTAYMIPKILRAFQAVKTRELGVITSALEELSPCIEKVTALISRIHEKCDPLIFYNEIRPFLAGSKNMGVAGLPNGVFYDEGDGKGQWMQFRGGSNGQSSLIQLIDMVLGVEHGAAVRGRPGTPAGDQACEMSFHEEVRAYMPGPHRRFLEHVSQMGSIRNLALLPTATTPEEKRLSEAFQKAVKALADFRNKHLGIVARYVVLPTKVPYDSGRNDLASTSTRLQLSGGQTDDLTGTAGTVLIPFLKRARDETLMAGAPLAAGH